MKKFMLGAMLPACALALTLAIPAFAQDRDHDNDHDRWENRNGWDYSTYNGEQRPMGWTDGKRTEWSNCEAGNGKHHECYTYSYQGTPYYYYRDDNGQLVVRRKHHDHDHDNDHGRDDRH